MAKTALIVKVSGRYDEVLCDGEYILGNEIENNEEKMDKFRDIERYGTRMFDRSETNIQGQHVRTVLYEY